MTGGGTRFTGSRWGFSGEDELPFSKLVCPFRCFLVSRLSMCHHSDPDPAPSVGFLNMLNFFASLFSILPLFSFFEVKGCTGGGATDILFGNDVEFEGPASRDDGMYGVSTGVAGADVALRSVSSG